jgi:hypothetical protein
MSIVSLLREKRVGRMITEMLDRWPAARSPQAVEWAALSDAAPARRADDRSRRLTVGPTAAV